MKRTQLIRKTALRAQSQLKRCSPLKRTSPLSSSTSPASKPRPALKRGAALRQRGKIPMTPAEVARCARMRAIGCIACIKNSALAWRRAPVHLGNPLEIHHLLSGGRRRGHGDTVCLCRFHHQGDRFPLAEGGYRAQSATFGPSFGREPNRFREMYGAEDALLAYQEALLAPSDAVH